MESMSEQQGRCATGRRGVPGLPARWERLEPRLHLSGDPSPAPAGAAFVSGRVWADLNGDGQPDSGEPGQPGVTVFADLNGDGLLDAGEPSCLTLDDDPLTPGEDEAGRYLLNVQSGTLLIRQVVPDQHEVTSPAEGLFAFAQSLRDGIGGIDGLDSPRGLAVSPDSSQLYATGLSDDALVVFDRDDVTGLLTPSQLLQIGRAS